MKILGKAELGAVLVGIGSIDDEHLPKLMVNLPGNNGGEGVALTIPASMQQCQAAGEHLLDAVIVEVTIRTKD